MISKNNDMDDSVKQQLSKIIAQEGINIVQDPRRFKAYLVDLCPTAKRQVRALLMVLDEGYVNKILQDNICTPSGILLHRFSSLLHDEAGLDLVLAQWAVQTWIEAVFPDVVVTTQEQSAKEQPTSAPSNNVQDVVPEWMKLLWDWADANDISEKKLSRTKYELINLRALDLNSNELTNLPIGIGQLTNLTSLNLRHNKFTILPDVIGQLLNLTSIDLSSNNFSFVPSEIFKIRKLTSLDLSFNRITYLPPELGKLNKLQLLDLANNRIISLPEEIKYLKNLELLKLTDNKLWSLPSEIGSLASLKELYLASNKIKMMPPEVSKLVNLVYVEIGYNNFSDHAIEDMKKCLPNCHIVGLSTAKLPWYKKLF